MPQLVETRCPGCKTTVRLPDEWLGKTVRCKRCRASLRVRSKSKPTPTASASVLQAKPETTPMAVPEAVALPDPYMAMEARAAEPPVAVSIEDDDPFSNLDDSVAPVVRTTSPRRRSWSGVMLSIFLLVVVGGLGAAFVVHKQNSGATDSADKRDPEKEPDTKPIEKPVEPPKHAGLYPRRLLAVSINNYLYANPVSFGIDVKDFSVLAGDLAAALKVPNEQLVVVTDSAPAGKAMPPMKAILEHTIGEFLDTSRPQDRIVLLLCCHVVDIDNEPYLVPFEGLVDEKETLIPVQWLMQRLDRCPARQKLLIADFCPNDRSRGQERPGSPPMGKTLDALLANPPGGVQVWSSCTAGQQSQEGIFLDELAAAVRKRKSRKTIDLGEQKPENSLPFERLATDVGKRTMHEVKRLYKANEQTPRVSGVERAGGAEYDPTIEPPPRVVAKHPALAEGVAPPAFVLSMLQQVDLPPTKKIGEGMQPLSPHNLPLFSAKIVEEYAEEPADTPLRQAVVKAITALRRLRPDDSFREEFRVQVDLNRAKQEILRDQKKPAEAQLKLADVMLELEQAGEKLDAEPSKRWRVLYQFTLAKLRQRIAYLIEYNYMLGLIRGDALPERDPEKYSGWRLASQVKLQCAGSASSEGKDARKYAKESKDLFLTIAKDHAGTPYEILARRESTTALGLEWQLMR